MRIRKAAVWLVLVFSLGITGMSVTPVTVQAEPQATTAVEAPERPVHNWDVYSYWHCGATRLHSYVFVTHSQPSDLAPGYVFYYCTSDQVGGGYKEQWWAVASVDTGESAVWIPWRFCYLGEYCAPEP